MTSLENQQDIIDIDFPQPGPVTQKTIQGMLNYAQRYWSSARETTGRIFTDSEYEARKQRILSTPLQ